MKYSLSSRQTAEYLKQADEIKVQYRDRRIIPDLIEKYPQARIDLALPYVFTDEEPIDWNEIDMYNKLAQGNFIIGVVTTPQIKEAKRLGLTKYHRSPLHSFQEIKDMRDAGMDEMYLAAPVFFQLDKVARYYPEMKIRAVANVALPEGSLSYNNGVRGTWIRPEDVPTYDPYISVIEFQAEQKPEQAMFRIYAQQHNWSRELNYIVKDLDHPAMNRMIPPTLAEARIKCGQRCMESGHCHLCERLLDLANPDLIRQILDAKEQS